MPCLDNEEGAAPHPPLSCIQILAHTYIYIYIYIHTYILNSERLHANITPVRGNVFHNLKEKKEKEKIERKIMVWKLYS